MKVMYKNGLKVLMMANMLHVRFVGRNVCSIEAVQHLRSGNACVYGTRRRPLVAQRVYTNVIEISVILIKQSLYD